MERPPVWIAPDGVRLPQVAKHSDLGNVVNHVIPQPWLHFPLVLCPLPVKSEQTFHCGEIPFTFGSKANPADRPTNRPRKEGEGKGRERHARVLRSLGRKSRGVHSFVNSAVWKKEGDSNRSIDSHLLHAVGFLQGSIGCKM